jgi:hypothetical protein
VQDALRIGLAKPRRRVELTARALSAVWHEARIIICLPGSAPWSLF